MNGLVGGAGQPLADGVRLQASHPAQLHRGVVTDPLPDQFPVVDPMITLAESTVGRDVQTVIIDGRIVLRDGELTTVDLAPMREHLRNQYQRIMTRYDEAIG